MPAAPWACPSRVLLGKRGFSRRTARPTSSRRRATPLGTGFALERTKGPSAFRQTIREYEREQSCRRSIRSARDRPTPSVRTFDIPCVSPTPNHVAQRLPWLVDPIDDPPATRADSLRRRIEGHVVLQPQPSAIAPCHHPAIGTPAPLARPGRGVAVWMDAAQPM